MDSQHVDRLTLVNEVPGAGCLRLVLDIPVLLQTGDRYRLEHPAGLVVEHADGRTSTYTGSFETCRHR